MKLPTSGLTGAVLNFANQVNQYIAGLRSVQLTIVDAVADLPNATAWQGRSIIVRDIGGGDPGVATALDGVWIDYAGATL